MKKTILIAIALLAFSMPHTYVCAQKFIGKSLITENNKEDGFEFKWYLYKYLKGQDTLYAAFSVNGTRITPICERLSTEKHVGLKPSYCGGGLFMYGTKEDNAFGEVIRIGYNLRGEVVFDKALGCYFIYYKGDGIFKLEFRNDYGRTINAAYSASGQCLIPRSMGFNWIAFYPEHNCFWCDYKTKDDEKIACYTFSSDGKYYVEGCYSYTNGEYEPKGHYRLDNPKALDSFNKYKKESSRFVGRYGSASPSSNNASSHSSSSSTATTSSSKPASSNSEPGLMFGSGYAPSTYSGSGSGSNSSSGTSTNPVQPHQKTKSCTLCNGSGKCANCNGKGWHYGYGGSTVNCSNCSRNGRCPSCGGSGKKTTTEYY